MESKQFNRNSNIELLRMICMFVIILHHSVLYGGALEQPASINLIIANLFYIGGKFGANCFMAISAYFLIDSKFKVQKVISVWKHTFFYGLTFFLLNTILHFKAVGVGDILEVVFPISYKAYWYVTAYVAIILLSPFINKLINRLIEKQYKYLIFVLLILVTLPVTFLPKAKPYYDESHVLLFVLIYFIIGFYKKGYIKNSKGLSIGFIIIGFSWLIFSSLAIILLGAFLENSTIIHYSTFWMNGESLPMIMAAIGVTIFVLEHPSRSNKYINSCAKGSFDIYLFHMNHFVYEWLWSVAFPIKMLLSKKLFPIYDILIGVLVFSLALFIGILRCNIFKIIESNVRVQFIDNLEIKINNIFNNKGDGYNE